MNALPVVRGDPLRGPGDVRGPLVVPGGEHLPGLGFQAPRGDLGVLRLRGPAARRFAGAPPRPGRDAGRSGSWRPGGTASRPPPAGGGARPASCGRRAAGRRSGGSRAPGRTGRPMACWDRRWPARPRLAPAARRCRSRPQWPRRAGRAPRRRSHRRQRRRPSSRSAGVCAAHGLGRGRAATRPPPAAHRGPPPAPADGRALPLRRFEMWPGLHGTIRASSRTPTPRAAIRRASSVPKSLICVYRVEDEGRCPYGVTLPNVQRLQATPRPGLDCPYPRRHGPGRR